MYGGVPSQTPPASALLFNKIARARRNSSVRPVQGRYSGLYTLYEDQTKGKPGTRYYIPLRKNRLAESAGRVYAKFNANQHERRKTPKLSPSIKRSP